MNPNDIVQYVGPTGGGCQGVTPAALVNSVPVPLSQLSQSSATSGQLCSWNGTHWVPIDPPAVDIPLSNLTQSSATSGQVPAWNGTAWVPATPAGGVTEPAIIGTPTTPQTSVDVLIASASSGHRTLVVQMKSGQSPNGFEIEDYNAVPKFFVSANGDATAVGNITSNGFIIGDGSNVTNLQAGNIASGGTLPALDGSALTNLPAGQLTGSLPAIDGSQLTGLPVPQSGTCYLTAGQGTVNVSAVAMVCMFQNTPYNPDVLTATGSGSTWTITACNGGSQDTGLSTTVQWIAF